MIWNATWMKMTWYSMDDGGEVDPYYCDDDDDDDATLLRFVVAGLVPSESSIAAVDGILVNTMMERP
jgi:hypothetical protein